MYVAEIRTSLVHCSKQEGGRETNLDRQTDGQTDSLDICKSVYSA